MAKKRPRQQTPRFPALPAFLLLLTTTLIALWVSTSPLWGDAAAGGGGGGGGGAGGSAEPWTAPARAAKKKNPVPADEASIAAGKQVYVKQCQSCHGPTGKGDGPASKDLNPKPRDISDPKIAGQTDGSLFWKLTEGRKPMPSFDKLIPEADRWNVINYVRTLQPPQKASGG